MPQLFERTGTLPFLNQKPTVPNKSGGLQFYVYKWFHSLHIYIYTRGAYGHGLVGNVGGRGMTGTDDLGGFFQL